MKSSQNAWMIKFIPCMAVTVARWNPDHVWLNIRVNQQMSKQPSKICASMTPPIISPNAQYLTSPFLRGPSADATCSSSESQGVHILSSHGLFVTLAKLNKLVVYVTIDLLSESSVLCTRQLLQTTRRGWQTPRWSRRRTTATRSRRRWSRRWGRTWTSHIVYSV